MALLMRKSFGLNNVVPFLRLASSKSGGSSSPKKSGTSPAQSVKEVPGPSKQVFREINSGEVLGPGADKSGQYPNPEYFQYHTMSYVDCELEMMQYRLPQPSSKQK